MSPTILFSLMIGIIILLGQRVKMCNDKANDIISLNTIESVKNRARSLSRFWRIFLYYCCPDKIDDEKLLAAEDCSPRKLLVS